MAVAILEDRTVTERWLTFLDPGPNSRVRVAGIDLAGQPTFADVALQLAELFSGGVLVAHNARFDLSFLAAEYQRAGSVMPEVPVICHQLRTERDAAYARMRPEHRAAHQRKDALEPDEVRASIWLPVLQALEAADCPEVADAWLEYARRLQGPARNANRVLEALHRSLDLRLSSTEATRAAVDDAVMWIRITCDDANLPDKLITAYQTFGPRLAALPPCGMCGNLTMGCIGGNACMKADLASAAAWATFHVDFDAGEDEDPQIVERRARAVLPQLAAERDLTEYVRLAPMIHADRSLAWDGRRAT